MAHRRPVRLALGSLTAGLFLLSVARAASPADVVDKYFARLTTWSADFEQTVTGEAGSAPRVASGHLYLSKPGKFRWDYKTPNEQLILADGRKLWFYDKDLAQVNVRDMDATLASTPAVLLSSGEPVSREFDITALPDRDGLNWFELRPRRKNSDFLAARIGFAHGELRRMQLADKLNQLTELDFSHAVRNRPLPADLFTFTPPPGADVIGAGAGPP
ncbi:MAG: outer membrane lipoprotein chaperone LolA [Proteobacteria bacterium]|nr:outer membrane lipoprotein chaperone LolA [Pseudomonadota bacterium]